MLNRYAPISAGFSIEQLRYYPETFAVIIVNRDGSLTTEGVLEPVTGQIKDTIEVSEDQIAQQPDLIDHIFTFAFDVLSLQTIDLCIRPVSLAGYPD
jgi:hypothetical protein